MIKFDILFFKSQNYSKNKKFEFLLKVLLTSKDLLLILWVEVDQILLTSKYNFRLKTLQSQIGLKSQLVNVKLALICLCFFTPVIF